MHACTMYVMQNYILTVLKLPFKKSKVVGDPRKKQQLLLAEDQKEQPKFIFVQR